MLNSYFWAKCEKQTFFQSSSKVNDFQINSANCSAQQLIDLDVCYFICCFTISDYKSKTHYTASTVNIWDASSFIWVQLFFFLLLGIYANFLKPSMNLTALQRNQKCLRQLSSYNINEPHVLLPREGSKQGRSFVFVISPPAHGDRNVSKTLWLTKDISTPRSQGPWEHCGKWLPCGHFEHTRPIFLHVLSSLKLIQRGHFFSHHVRIMELHWQKQATQSDGY